MEKKARSRAGYALGDQELPGSFPKRVETPTSQRHWGS